MCILDSLLKRFNQQRIDNIDQIFAESIMETLESEIRFIMNAIKKEPNDVSTTENLNKLGSYHYLVSILKFRCKTKMPDYLTNFVHEPDMDRLDDFQNRNVVIQNIVEDHYKF